MRMMRKRRSPSPRLRRHLQKRPRRPSLRRRQARRKLRVRSLARTSLRSSLTLVATRMKRRRNLLPKSARYVLTCRDVVWLPNLWSLQ